MDCQKWTKGHEVEKNSVAVVMDWNGVFSC